MAELYTGRMHNGMVVFGGEAPPLEEGALVHVVPIGAKAAGDDVAGDPVGETRRLLLAWARRVEAVAPPLPVDLASEHDHYAHGKPRP